MLSLQVNEGKSQVFLCNQKSQPKIILRYPQRSFHSGGKTNPDWLMQICHLFPTEPPVKKKWRKLVCEKQQLGRKWSGHDPSK